MTDRELIDQFRRTRRPGDLLPLYGRYAELMYGWCLRYLGTPQRAEDAGAELFPVLLTKLASHDVTNYRAWLQTLVRNHCLMQLRREKRDPLRQTRGSLMHSDELLHLREEAAEAPDTRALHRCLRRLAAEQQRCIRLFYLQEGLSYRDIAEQLALSVGQVRSHLQNGRRNLKTCLESQYPLDKTDSP
ncbi:sigma-70 family RNA polymerase sigma factor [Lewinella sp. JB7]|uniref:RNA polymerase sigma factor n=1 Tax=Lewinella sp. JB7 TaxID=2962887 RepID=UPI0020C9413C|nr:sigma-70 family RNA polymerase sigma factor [Lewinella sp. JB7]